MLRLLSALVLLSGVCASAVAAPVPVVPSDLTKDREGNPLPKGATARLGSLAFRMPNGIGFGLWYSADGESLFRWDKEQMIGWDANTGKRLERGPFPLGQKFVGYFPVFAGGRLISFEEAYGDKGGPPARQAIVTGSDGKVISRIDCSSYALGNVSPSTPNYFALSGDGTRAAHVADDRTVRAFDLNTGKEIFKEKLDTKQPVGVVLAPDGRTLFVQEVRKNVRRFSLPDGKELSPLVIDEGWLRALVVSADGTRAATVVSTWEKTPGGGSGWIEQDFVLLHDLTTGKAVGKIETGGRAYCGPMLGSEAIFVGSGTYRHPAPRTEALARWNLKTLKKEWELPGSGGVVLAPDGKRMALASLAGIRILDPATGKRLDTAVAHPHPIGRIEFSADGETLTTRCQSARMTWTLRGERTSVADGPELWDGRSGPAGFSPRVWFEIGADGKTVELAGGDFDRRKDAWRVPLGADVPERPLSVDGKRVIGAVYDAKQARWDVTVYDGPTGKRAATWTVPAKAGATGHPAMILSGDGKTLFGFDGDVVGRDPDTGAEKVRVKTGAVAIPGGASLPFQLSTTSDGGRVAIGQQNQKGGGGAVRVFDTKTGKELAAHDIGRAYSPAFVFDRSGSQIAVRSGESVLLCDAKGTAEPRKLTNPLSRPTCTAFSPNGAALAVGYEDGTALVWDLTAK